MSELISSAELFNSGVLPAEKETQNKFWDRQWRQWANRTKVHHELRSGPSCL
jgi:hypothetical protein